MKIFRREPKGTIGMPPTREQPGLLVVALVFALGITAIFWPLTAATLDTSKIPPAAERKIDFLKDIQPLFADHCYQCHGPKKQEASLRLDQKAAALQGSENGL